MFHDEGAMLLRSGAQCFDQARQPVEIRFLEGPFPVEDEGDVAAGEMGEHAAADGKAPAAFFRQPVQPFHFVRGHAGPAGYAGLHAAGQEPASRKRPHRFQRLPVRVSVQADDAGRSSLPQEPFAFTDLPVNRLFRSEHARNERKAPV